MADATGRDSVGLRPVSAEREIALAVGVGSQTSITPKLPPGGRPIIAGVVRHRWIDCDTFDVILVQAKEVQEVAGQFNDSLIDNITD